MAVARAPRPNGPVAAEVAAAATGRAAADEPDPRLLALVEEPYGSVDDVRERLRELLSAFEARDDPRADFLRVYARMTDAVAERIRQGGFGDPEWVADYLVAFADLYREAVHAREAGDHASLPAAWRLAFEATARDQPAVRNAALGVNAHINYDLALALDAVGIDGDRETRRRDHAAVTEVIADLVGEAWDGLTARDATPGHGGTSLDALDEGVAVLAIDECRDRAWGRAVALGSRFRSRRRLARLTNRLVSTAGARLLTSATSAPVDDAGPATRSLDIGASAPGFAPANRLQRPN